MKSQILVFSVILVILAFTVLLVVPPGNSLIMLFIILIAGILSIKVIAERNKIKQK